MGGFLGTLYLRTKDRRRVRAALEGLAGDGCRFVLAPPIAGWTAVYPNEEGQDPAVLARLIREVGGAALYVYASGADVFGYELFHDGETLDEFCSWPDDREEVTPEDRQRLRGRPEQLAAFLSEPHALAALEALLHPAEGHAPGAANLALREVARLLRLPNVGISYDDLTREESPSVWRLVAAAGRMAKVRGYLRFEHFPNLRPPRRTRRQRQTARAERIRQLQADGALLFHTHARKGWFRSPEPFLASHPHGAGFYVAAESTGLLELLPPWELRKSILACAESVERVFLSPMGTYLAVAVRGGTKALEVWDLETSRRVLACESYGSIAVDFNAAERLLLELDAEALRVFDLPSGRQRKQIKCPGARSACFDPTGQGVVVADGEHVALFDWRTGKRLRRWLLGEPLQHEAELESAREEIRDSFDRATPQQFELHLRRMKSQLNLPDRFVGETMAEVQQAQQQILAPWDSEEFLEERGVFGSESAYRIAFVPYSRWFVCGASRGVRVYEWEEMLAASRPLPATAGMAHDRATPPPPHYAAEGAPYREEGEEAFHHAPRDAAVHALAYDAEMGRLLYGGAGGRIESLDLRSGRQQTLIELPGRPTLHDLALSRDGAALACTTVPQVHRDPPQLAPEVYVWDYRALLRSLPSQPQLRTFP